MLLDIEHYWTYPEKETHNCEHVFLEWTKEHINNIVAQRFECEKCFVRIKVSLDGHGKR